MDSYFLLRLSILYKSGGRNYNSHIGATPNEIKSLNYCIMLFAENITEGTSKYTLELVILPKRTINTYRCKLLLQLFKFVITNIEGCKTN